MRPPPKTLRLAVLLLAGCALPLGCATGRTLSKERHLPPPAGSSAGAKHRYGLARQSVLAARRLDLPPAELAEFTHERVIPYLESAAANDPLASPFLETLIAESLLLAEGEESEAALARFVRSVERLGDWWPIGWLGIARCRSAAGDAAGAQQAMERARLGILKLEERLVIGPDLPPERNFLEVVGLLPPSPPEKTANDRILEAYYLMVREYEFWQLPSASVPLLGAAECVQRLKSRLHLLQAELHAASLALPALRIQDLDLILAADPNFVEARVLKVHSLLESGETLKAWQLVAPLVDVTNVDPDAAVTRADARILLLAARVAGRHAHRSPRGALDGLSAFEVAEGLFASAHRLNPRNARALVDRADNLVSCVESDPAMASRLLPIARAVLEEAASIVGASSDAERLRSIEGRIVRSQPGSGAQATAGR